MERPCDKALRVQDTKETLNFLARFTALVVGEVSAGLLLLMLLESS